MFKSIQYITILAAAVALIYSAGAQTQAPAPDFHLRDVSGKLRSLQQFRGQPLVLFFFCGCIPCHNCAALWGEMQRTGAVPPTARTLAVFLGDGAAAQSFAKETGLLVRQTVLLADPELKVARLYRAAPCPRVFVLDAAGRILYTNNHKEDAHQSASAAAVLSRVIDALRSSLSASKQSHTPASIHVEMDAATPAHTEIDIGKQDAMSSPYVERTILLHNRSAEPLTVASLTASCGCTTLLTGKSGEFPYRLNPGKEMAVAVRIDLSHLRAGRIDKFIWVNLAGQSSPSETIEIVGNLRESVSLTPSLLDFGKVISGQSKTLTLKATLDKRLLTGGAWPKLASSESGVQVAPAGCVTLEQIDGKPALSQLYEARLSSRSHLGILSGSVFFSEPYTNDPSEQTRSAILMGVTSSIRGEVAGAVRAEPGMAAFGSVLAKSGATLEVIVTGTSIQGMEGLKVTSATPLLTVRLVPMAENGLERKLEIKVSDAAPIGTLESQITVETREGQRLTIPVVASVRRK